MDHGGSGMLGDAKGPAMPCTVVLDVSALGRFTEVAVTPRPLGPGYKATVFAFSVIDLAAS